MHFTLLTKVQRLIAVMSFYSIAMVFFTGMLASIIFNKLLKLPEETLLYPAHDYKGEKVSTIGKEKKQNPRLQVSSVDEYIEIMNNLNLKKPAQIDFNVSKNINLGV